MKMMVSKFGISSSSSMLIFGGVLLNNSLLIILKKAGYFGGWHWGPEDNMEPENTALEKETHLNQTIIFSLKNCSSSFIFRFCVIPLASHWFSPNGSPTKKPVWTTGNVSPLFALRQAQETMTKVWEVQTRGERPKKPTTKPPTGLWTR